jgi:predicted SprT family Zn-dependent metalloprotease
VSLAGVAIILFGTRYAWGPEHLRQTDLPNLYQQINAQSFDGSLPNVAVEWSQLPDNYGETRFYDDGRVEIGIDRESVTDDEELRETMQHEMCHVATHDDVVPLHPDDHGDLFQSCMKGFE